MDRKKAILVFLRVSTEAQELEEQKNEMRVFCLQHGYAEGEIIYVEGRGASAIGVNEAYLQMYEQVRCHIDDGSISAVAVWAVNRLARDEEFFVRFKKLFIENKVQFLVKNPTLALLNPDGTVNAGNELALSLFSTMAKQEMEERKAKFSRTKRAYARLGKWSGGHTRKFGYRVDEAHLFVEDPNDAAIVRLIFELYATGRYSACALSDELNARGLQRGDGLPINPPFITRILGCRSYFGAPDLQNNSRVYPPLISEDLFMRCRSVASQNRLSMRRSGALVLSSKLVRCPACGASFTSNGRHLGCCRNRGRHKRCGNNLQLRQSIVDSILWQVAFRVHLRQLLDHGLESLAPYRREVAAIDRNLSDLEALLGGGVCSAPDLDPKQKYDIIHQHILRVVPERVWWGGAAGILLHVYTASPAPSGASAAPPGASASHGPSASHGASGRGLGDHHQYLYLPKSNRGPRLYVWNGDNFVICNPLVVNAL